MLSVAIAGAALAAVGIAFVCLGFRPDLATGGVFRDQAGHRSVHQTNRHDRALRALWQTLHQPPDVMRAFGVGIVIMRHDFIGLVDRHLGERRTIPTQKIDQLVERNGVDPRRKRLPRIIGMPLEVDRQYGFLDQIFGLRSHPADRRQPGLVIGTQLAAQPIEQRGVMPRR